MYKLLVSDLDRTALKKFHVLSDKNREAIVKARELGVRFVPATGRSYASVEDTLKDLGLFDRENEYVISYNGAVITENKDDKILDFQTLPFEVADKIYRRMLDYDLEVHVYTPDTNYIFRPRPEKEKLFFADPWRKEIHERDLSFLKGQKIIKMLLDNPDTEYLKNVERELSDIKDHAETTYSSFRMLEILPKGVDKSTAMLKLAERLNVSPEEIIAVGDDFNDQSMIEKAGLGVVVQNGRDAVKAAADYVTERTNEEDAIAEIIEKFILPQHASSYI